MHARSASLDFQAHLQYEKIRKSGMPGAAAAAMESCGQQVVSRNHEHHQQMIEKHQLQQSGSVAPSTSGSSPRNLNLNTAPLENADESEDDDERLLQQAIGNTLFEFLSFQVVLHSLHFCRTFQACV